jgi:hypothetical protein
VTTTRFREEAKAVLTALIEIAEEYAILYEDGLNVSPEERKQNTRVTEVEETLVRARKVLLQFNQIPRSIGEAQQGQLRVLAAAAYTATWTVQPADSPLIDYEAFEHVFHADREVVDWLIERIREKYGYVEVWNAHIECELDKLSQQIQLDQAYEAAWLVSPVDVQDIAEQHGIDLSTIEEYVEEVARTQSLEQITNGDVLLWIARVRADQVTFPGTGGSEICTVKTNPAYQQYLVHLLGESAFVSSSDVDIRAVAHYYDMTEREVRQVMAFLALQGSEQLTNGLLIATIGQAHGDWLLLGLLPNTNDLPSTEEAIRLGISTPYIPCECGERMYKGDGINTLFGPYCSEECVHRYVCMSYALAGFVTDEDVANPNHPIYHWVCKHETSTGH